MNLRTVLSHYERGTHDKVVTETTSMWKNGQSMPSADLAEACRLASIASVGLGLKGQSDLWRTRAVVAATTAGAPNVTAAVLIGTALAVVGEGYAQQALEMLDAIEQLIDGDAKSGLSGGTTLRLLYEKRGCARFMLGQYSAAESEYDNALSFVSSEDTRGEIKVRAGKLLCKHELGDRSAAEDSKGLGRRAREAGFERLADDIDENVARMLDDQRVVPYETLK